MAQIGTRGSLTGAAGSVLEAMRWAAAWSMDCSRAALMTTVMVRAIINTSRGYHLRPVKGTIPAMILSDMAADHRYRGWLPQLAFTSLRNAVERPFRGR